MCMFKPVRLLIQVLCYVGAFLWFYFMWKANVLSHQVDAAMTCFRSLKEKILVVDRNVFLKFLRYVPWVGNLLPPTFEKYLDKEEDRYHPDIFWIPGFHDYIIQYNKYCKIFREWEVANIIFKEYRRNKILRLLMKYNEDLDLVLEEPSQLLDASEITIFFVLSLLLWFCFSWVIGIMFPKRKKIKIDGRVPPESGIPVKRPRDMNTMELREYNRQRRAAARAAETAVERANRNDKKQIATAAARAAENEVERAERLYGDMKATAASRAAETEVERAERLYVDMIATTAARAAENAVERADRNKRNRESIQKARDRPMSINAWRNTQRVLYGLIIVKTHSLGAMDKRCTHCNALKWKHETPSTCCLGGKIDLQHFPDPPDGIKRLLTEDTIEGKLFREHTRSFNNALALSCIMVNEKKLKGKYKPAVVFEGKLCHMIGPLQSEKGQEPRFAQLYNPKLYVHDPAMEETIRVGNMNLPCSLTKHNSEAIKRIMKICQKIIKDINPFVKDFMFICEVMEEEEIEDGKLVIGCKDRPKGRYNHYEELKEVSIITNTLPGDLVLRKRGGGFQFVYDLHPSAMPLHFTLMFPYGTKGYNLDLRQLDKNRMQTDKRVTPRQWFAFHLNMRDRKRDYLFRWCRAFQEWVCLAYHTVESQRLKYHMNNQKALRADTYKNIKETLEERLNVPLTDKIYQDDNQPGQRRIGKKVILPPSFVGSPRWYNANFLDAMAIVREHHKPDFFITFTCNPNWFHIVNELRPGETASDRPDLVARVFKQKKDELLRDIKVRKCLGRTVADLYVIEWQKRGLPHAHLLIILAEEDRISCGAEVDDFIWAQLPPDPETFPEGSEAKLQAKRLEEIVLKNMIHGPCGYLKPDSPCMVNGICSKRFPMAFCETTVVNADNTYPRYQRLAPEDGGRSIVRKIKGKEYVIDNRWVVPYNPYILLDYDAHINIEICVSPMAAKYLYKYVFKGLDRVMVRTVVGQQYESRDEIKEYQDLRSIGSSEAAWKLLNFPIARKNPPVTTLRVHLEDEQNVVFDEGTEEEVVQKIQVTELTGFFNFNQLYPDTIRNYVDFPKYFVWLQRDKKWTERKNRLDTIGRVNNVPPSAGDVFYLRMLLHHDHCKGKNSFKDLRTLNGTLYENYQDICRELGLLQDDREWDEVLSNGAVTKMSSALRELYVIILLFCQPSNPSKLFEDHYLEWTDDFEREAEKVGQVLTAHQRRTMVLQDLEQRFLAQERTLKTYQLPVPTEEELKEVEFSKTNIHPALIREELNFDLNKLKEVNSVRIAKLNAEQRDVFDTVMAAVRNEQPLCLFVEARGGTGKTFVLKTILEEVRQMDSKNGGSVALAVAFTGLAANLLPLGRTFHSRFKAPLNPSEDSNINISAQSTLAQLIRLAKIIVIDEAPMLHRYQLEYLDKTLQDIIGSGQPFGGKVIVLSGDYRQLLPVISHVDPRASVFAAINRSTLWKHFTVKNMTENLRVNASGDRKLEEFDRWTLSIGNGTAPTVENTNLIQIPVDMCIEIKANSSDNPQAEAQSMERLAKQVYPALPNNYKNPDWMQGRAILAPTNKVVDQMNNIISNSFPGIHIVLSSSDELDNADEMQRYSTEYLNTLTPSGVAAHRLFIKEGMPLMLLRNLNPKMGLCNGTKLIFDKIHNNFLLECTIAGGEYKGRKVLIPRITMRPKDTDYVFEWSRRQFPVRLGFAMTINKSQGQTLQNVGVWLSDPCFSHGQLYVAVSRVVSPKTIKFAIRKVDNLQFNFTRNVVYKEVLNN